jgi:hypothetical protein
MTVTLRQSTSIDVRIGPFVDVGDGFTPETAIGNTPTNLTGVDEAELLKADGAATVDITSNTWAAVSGCDGWYDLTLTTSDTNTVGELLVVIQDDSVCLPVYQRFQVVEEAIYDALFASSATGLLPANVTQFGGSAGTFSGGRPEVNTSHIAGTAQTANDVGQDVNDILVDTADMQPKLGTPSVSVSADIAANLAAVNALNDPTAATIADAVWDEAQSGHTTAGTFGKYLDTEVSGVGGGSGLTALASGTAQAGGTSTQIILAAAASFADDILNGCVVNLLTGTGAGQSRVIVDYAGASDTATVSPAWTTNPDATTTYEIVQGSANVVTISLTAQTANDVGQDVNDILVDTAEIGAAGAGLTALAQAAVCTEARLAELDAANLPTTTDNILTDTNNIITDTADMQPKLGTITDLGSGATVGANLVDIEAQTDDIGAAGAGLTAIPDMALDSTVAKDATVAKAADLATVDTNVDSILVDTGTTIPGTITTLQTDVTQIKGDLPSTITKNVALAAFPFVMTDSTNHDPATGLTITAQRSIDGAAFVNCANAVAEVGSGMYKIDLANTDLNGDTICLKFTASGADTLFLTIVTQP